MYADVTMPACAAVTSWRHQCFAMLIFSPPLFTCGTVALDCVSDACIFHLTLHIAIVWLFILISGDPN